MSYSDSQKNINKRKHKPEKMTGNSLAAAFQRCTQNEIISGSIERTRDEDHKSGVCFPSANSRLPEMASKDWWLFS